MQTVGADDPVLHPEKATVLGPVKVIPREFPDLVCKSVDLCLPPRREGLRAIADSVLKRRRGSDRGALLDRITANLLKELDGRIASELVVHRGDQRFVRRFEEERLTPATSPAAAGLRPGGTYLLTGGLGGLALNLADRLTRDLKPRLILLGRSGLPPRGEWDAWLASRGRQRSDRPADPAHSRARAGRCRGRGRRRATSRTTSR